MATTTKARANKRAARVTGYLFRIYGADDDPTSFEVIAPNVERAIEVVKQERPGMMITMAHCERDIGVFSTERKPRVFLIA